MIFDRLYAIQILALLKEHRNTPEKLQYFKKNALIRNISLCQNVKSETIDDIIAVIQELINLTEDMQNNTEIEIEDLSSFLYDKNPKRYRYNDERYLLSSLYPITDSDFIDYHDFSDQARGLIYDILYNDHNGISVCDTLIAYHRLQENAIIQKVNLQYWNNCFQRIIERLSRQNDGISCVVIPFLFDYNRKIAIETSSQRIARTREEYEQNITPTTHDLDNTPQAYKRSVRYIIDLFKMAQDTTILLRESPKQDHYKTPKILNLKPLNTLFDEWEMYLIHHEDKEAADAVHGEMIRRRFIEEDGKPHKNYRKHFITVGFEDNIHDCTSPENVEPIKDSEKEKEKKYYAGVIIGMLKSRNVGDDLIKRVVHFIIEGPDRFISVNHNGTAYQYCQNLEHQVYNDGIRNAEINKVLSKYEFGELAVDTLLNEERERKAKRRKK